MSTETANGGLFGALAELQAKLPSIRKGETANVRSDKGNYSYKYADLTDVSEVLLPLMGSLGLAFTSRPTMRDGQFILAYSLVHVSGEREDGTYPLPAGGTPQAIGSAITYARRYCLCAVTGVAPGGDDDDAGAAEVSHRQSAADAWESAVPARPVNQGPRREINGTGPSSEAGPKDIDADAQKFADEARKATAPREMEDIHRRAREAGKLGRYARNPSSGGIGQLAVYLDWRRKQVCAAVQLSPDDPWAPKVEELTATADADTVLDEVTRMLTAGEIDDGRAERIVNAVIARFPDAGRAELAAAS